jgi:basic membrane lipoprotein Med (substrate-binding protein (PBP1-ABC) superfamily)
MKRKYQSAFLLGNAASWMTSASTHTFFGWILGIMVGTFVAAGVLAGIEAIKER